MIAGKGSEVDSAGGPPWGALTRNGAGEGRSRGFGRGLVLALIVLLGTGGSLFCQEQAPPPLTAPDTAPVSDAATTSGSPSTVGAESPSLPALDGAPAGGTAVSQPSGPSSSATGGDASAGASSASYPALATASPLLGEGERLFRENKPAEAAPRFEQALRDPATDERVWLWLAICYQQLNRPDDAVSTLRKGLAKAVEHRDLFLFDLGNLFLSQGKASFAKDMYDQAIQANPAMEGAFLNRANAAMLLSDYSSARDDYGRYLALDPASPQRASIEALLSLLGKSIAEAEAKKAQEEATRLAAEAAKKQLLDEVSASLKAAAEETTNLAAGSGQVQSYGDELPPSD